MKKVFSVYLDESLAKRVRVHCAEQGKTLSDFVSETLSEAIRPRAGKPRRQKKGTT